MTDRNGCFAQALRYYPFANDNDMRWPWSDPVPLLSLTDQSEYYTPSRAYFIGYGQVLGESEVPFLPEVNLLVFRIETEVLASF